MRYFLRYLETSLTKLLDSLKRVVHLFLPPPPPAFRPYFQLTLQPPINELSHQITTDLDTALQITHAIVENESEFKWKALGDRTLTVWRFDLAKEC